MEGKINKYKLKDNYISSLDRFIGRLTSEEKKIIDNGDNSDGNKN
jgi:hypothetical protein